MKNEFNKTNFIQDEILLHEANFQAKKCNSFHFSTISFNTFQIKLIILVALFIILIFNSNNCYAFEYTDINYDTMSTLTTDNISDFLITFNNYICVQYGTCPYYFISHDSSNYYIFNTLTPFYWKDNYNFAAQSVNNNNYYGVRSDRTKYYLWKVNSSGVTLSTSNNLSQGENIWYQGVKTDYFTNYDVYNDITQQNEFTKNFELTQEGGGDIDMSEVTNAIDTNSNIQILILFFLISMFVYLIFYTVANAGRRNK